MGWNLSTLDNQDWDIMWCDLAISNSLLGKMKSYQRINHFPGNTNKIIVSHVFDFKKKYVSEKLEEIAKIDPFRV
jgi:hypothetical protein